MMAPQVTTAIHPDGGPKPGISLFAAETPPITVQCVATRRTFRAFYRGDQCASLP